uniref:Protease complex subunit PrcB family protein n=1 Tax=Caldilinea aerophila TaxID=133453 RepID=A0A7C1JKQ9_9CHLR
MNWTRLPSLWPLLAVAALLLAGCQLSQVMPPAAAPPASGEVEIPFETIALDEIGVNYELSLIPQLILLTSSDDAAKIKDWVKAEVYTQLESLDFEQYAVIALFRGPQDSHNYQTVIERITRQNSRLTVYAQFWEPNPAWASATAETSPYHLVKIDRRQVPVSSVELVLQAHMLTPTPPAR